MADSKRQAGGRFAKGNPGGPGRPKRAREVEYLRVLFDACPIETWQRICEAAVRDAIAGDWRARNFLSHYLMGLPAGESLRLSQQERNERMAEMFPDPADPASDFGLGG